ncbi:hypothetical protein POVWA2_050250 [Plasmodium ovale wallikeri]|uniref:Uncharacterized protein n=1 Tax=Plasmodium ovale wallikeri TaxID=864142 RepID=A0A1A8ZNX7_PLAOA|nr:hypothetical protein POVWA1_001160 [Plasmodium ovale wallikeri]SBT45575.1 hypothetical protein POVWA2_050250 [Plasmodium ovale wallikeri]
MNEAETCRTLAWLSSAQLSSAWLLSYISKGGVEILTDEAFSYAFSGENFPSDDCQTVSGRNKWNYLKTLLAFKGFRTVSARGGGGKGRLAKCLEIKIHKRKYIKCNFFLASPNFCCVLPHVRMVPFSEVAIGRFLRSKSSSNKERLHY